MNALTSPGTHRWLNQLQSQLHMEWRQMLRTPAFSWPSLLFPAVFYALLEPIAARFTWCPPM